MSNKSISASVHVGEALSGYIDGELTQQQRQRVELHCSQCEQCSGELKGLRELRLQVGKSQLGELDEDVWRESMADTTVRATRSVGWIVFIAGVLLLSGVVLLAFLADPSMTLGMKALLGAIYGGLGLVFVSVLRQRIIERKKDKYKDVEI